MQEALGCMICLECGLRWEVLAVRIEQPAYVIVDDLCPMCGAQGEPVDIWQPPGRDDSLNGFVGDVRTLLDSGYFGPLSRRLAPHVRFLSVGSRLREDAFGRWERRQA